MAKSCDCLASNCKNCTLSECEICDDDHIHHQTRLNAHSCEIDTSLNVANNCLTGYGPDLLNPAPPGHTPVCKQCANILCSACLLNIRDCDDCAGNDIPFKPDLHPVTPSAIVVC